MSYFEKSFRESIQVKQECISNGFAPLYKMGETIVSSLQAGGKLLFCGNGGSAADAQHLAAELLVRLRPHVNRFPIPALTLAQDSSTLTACGNDYSFDQIFERNLRALARVGDCLIGISTSGNSQNVMNALIAAKDLGVHAFGFLGGDGGRCREVCDLSFIVPSGKTARVQESHIVAGHALMEMVEDGLLGDTRAVGEEVSLC